VTGGIKREAGMIAGHEPCGIVAAVGSGVAEKETRVGQRVMDHHYDGCGNCKHCRAGWTQMCLEGTVVYGSGGHGGHAKYMKVPVSTLVPLPDSLSFVTGAAVSCGTGTAWGALKRVNLQGGETIAFFGQGPVGLSATQFAVAMGARVIAIDISPERRKLAQEFGAHEVIDPKSNDMVAAIRDLTHGEGAHKTLDASSAPEARAAAVRSVRSWGTACFVGERGQVTLDVSPDLLRPAGDAGRLLDVLEARARPNAPSSSPTGGGRGEALHASLEARAGGGGLQALRHADDGQGRHPAVLRTAPCVTPYVEARPRRRARPASTPGVPATVDHHLPVDDHVVDADRELLGLGPRRGAFTVFASKTTTSALKPSRSSPRSGSPRRCAGNEVILRMASGAPGSALPGRTRRG
jgi:NADPH:quinone reductase-like Zn-dependent oxidoreductase